MKRLLLVLAASLLVVAGAIAGDPDTLLVLRNGSEVRGVLKGLKDGVYTMELRDGREMAYAVDDVDRMERLAPPPAQPPAPPPQTAQALQPCKVFITEGTLDQSLLKPMKEIKVSKKWKGGNVEEAYGMLADLAMKMKADGVMKVRTWEAPSGFSWTAPHAGGMAFTWTEAGRAALPNLKGRCF